MANDAGMWIDEKTSAPANPGALVVKFHLDSKLMPHKSEHEGHPVFEQVERVTIWTDKDNSNIFDVNESHRRRWPAEYAAFKAGREQATSGTPLMALFPANPEVVDMLKAQQIHTVERLASITDGSQFKFAEPLAKKAREFLGRQKAEEMPKMQEDMAAMQRKIEELTALLANKPKRGRPPLHKEITA